jgi:hypothetical protein
VASSDAGPARVARVGARGRTIDLDSVHRARSRSRHGGPHDRLRGSRTRHPSAGQRRALHDAHQPALGRLVTAGWLSDGPSAEGRRRRERVRQAAVLGLPLSVGAEARTSRARRDLATQDAHRGVAARELRAGRSAVPRGHGVDGGHRSGPRPRRDRHARGAGARHARACAAARCGACDGLPHPVAQPRDPSLRPAVASVDRARRAAPARLDPVPEFPQDRGCVRRGRPLRHGPRHVTWPAATHAHPGDSRFIAPTLSFSIDFHRSTDSEWLLSDAHAPCAGDGRIFMHQRVWSPAGDLVASGTCTTICRPRPSGA